MFVNIESNINSKKATIDELDRTDDVFDLLEEEAHDRRKSQPNFYKILFGKTKWFIRRQRANGSKMRYEF